MLSARDIKRYLCVEDGALRECGGQRAVPQQLDGAMEIPLQPFGGDTRVGVVIQCFVHAGDRLATC